MNEKIKLELNYNSTKFKKIEEISLQNLRHQWISNSDLNVLVEYLRIWNLNDKQSNSSNQIINSSIYDSIIKFEENNFVKLLLNTDTYTNESLNNLFIYSKSLKKWREDGIDWDKRVDKKSISNNNTQEKSKKINESQKRIYFNGKDIGRVMYFIRKVPNSFFETIESDHTIYLKRRCYDVKECPYNIIQYLIEKSKFTLHDISIDNTIESNMNFDSNANFDKNKFLSVNNARSKTSFLGKKKNTKNNICNFKTNMNNSLNVNKIFPESLIISSSSICKENCNEFIIIFNENFDVEINQNIIIKVLLYSNQSKYELFGNFVNKSVISVKCK